ncbi:MAG: hypothetical protein IMF11_12770 [Proteobacteria bacterium]|nr:hypothetical protein [Pseudomonadota bacterium]
MKPEELSKHVTDTVNFSFDRLDTVRSGALNELKAFQQIKRDVLKKQKARLTEKLGPDHQKVVVVGKKIRNIDHMSKDLDVLITEANIKIESVDKNTWKIHGKVIDKDRKGIKNLTATLHDQKGKWLREMGYGCTDENGYFSISYTLTDETGPMISMKDKLFLYISNKKQTILYKDSEPLFIRPGRIDYKAIYISDIKEVCTPPVSDTDETELPTGRWVVKGRVTDEGGNGIGGVTVRLYDKEHIFDEKLGAFLADNDGNFMARYETENFRDLIEAKPDIYLKVINKEGETLYSSRKKVRCEAGRIETFKIRIKKK